MSEYRGVYDTGDYRKHKNPEGWGSLCPEDLPESPQALLDTGIAIADAIYNVSGDYALRAQQHRPGTWHGHPIPWSRLPSDAMKQLIASGRLNSATYRKAVRKSLGREFDR